MATNSFYEKHTVYRITGNQGSESTRVSSKEEEKEMKKKKKKTKNILSPLHRVHNKQEGKTVSKACYPSKSWL
jgi:hypothetical protein